MIARKTNGKAKDKSKVIHEKALATRKPAADSEPGVAVMDSRSGKERRGNDRRQKDVPIVAERRQLERRVKVNRRRQIDPTTCERDYTQEEIDFMGALDAYKRRSGRMFPTCSEILEVLRSIGYEKQAVAESPAPVALPIDVLTETSVESEVSVPFI